MSGAERPRVGLFVTCIVDAIRPQIGFAAIDLLEAAGCDVEVPRAQTCCGQPGYNSGDDALAREIARQVIAAFEGFDYVVVPSGSCAGMIRDKFAGLFEGDTEWTARQEALSAKTHELVSFLVDVMDFQPRGATYGGRVAYHDSCSSLRGLGVHAQPRRLLDAVEGVEIVPHAEAETCCGFGGTFCVKYPAISNAIVSEKARHIAESGADTVLAGDLGCLMNIAGKLSREGRAIRAFHIAEVLAGRAEGPGLCGGWR